MMNEDEQSNEPDEIARWVSSFQAIPALVMTIEEESSLLDWRKRTKEHNVEAVRRQMEEVP